MSGILDRCTCTPNARVFVAEGQVYCTRCLSARSLLPLNLQVPELGVLGLFYRPEEPLRWTLPRAFPTVECSPAGACWLSAIFPIARMTSGNLNFQQRMVRVAAEIYRAGQLTPTVLKTLQVYERGCRWYPIVGPVPGVGVFANSLHVSDKPFPGATHVLTNLPLPQRPKPEDFCPFECAMADVYDIGRGAVMYVAGGKVSWAPRGGNEVKFEPVPKELKLVANRLHTSFPPHHVVDMSRFIFMTPGSGVSMRVEYQYGCLPADTVPEGNCWWRLFDSLPPEVQYKEIRHANQFGYQTKHGVPGKYLQRRLQVNGLRAVTDTHGPIVIQYFSVKESWIRHLKLVEEPSLPGFEDLLRIRVEPNTSPLAGGDEKIFRFGSHKWYGAGKRARKTRSGATNMVAHHASSAHKIRQATKHEGAGANKAEHLKRYSPPAEGNCGWHCISAIANRMVNSNFETTLPERVRPSDDWATDEDLVNAIQILRLPAALDRNGACGSAKYVLKLEGEHWTVSVIPGMSPTLLPLECVQGCCEHKGGLVSPDAVEISGFDPACLDRLAKVMHLPSSTIPAALAELSDDSNRPVPPAATTWTVSQFYARHRGGDHHDQVCLGKIISLCQVIEDCCCHQNKTNRATPEEVAAKIDQYLRDATSLEECLAKLERVSPPSAADTSFDWNVVLPGVEATNQTTEQPHVNSCCTPVPPVTQEPLGEDSVPLTAFSLFNCYYPAQGDEVHHRERLKSVLSKLEEVVLEEYGLMSTGLGPRPVLPSGLDELKDQMEGDLLELANTQATSEMMAWAAEQVDLKAWVKSYPRWTPPPPPPRVQPRRTKSVKSLPEDKPVPAPRRKVRSDCGSPVSMGDNVPNGSEETVGGLLNFPTPSEPMTPMSEPVLVPASRRVPKLMTPLSGSAPVPAPRRTVTTTLTHQDEPLDLSASSQTEYEASPLTPSQNMGILEAGGQEAEGVLSEISDILNDTNLAPVSSSSSLGDTDELLDRGPSAPSKGEPVCDQPAKDPRMSPRESDESIIVPPADTGGVGSFTDLPSSDGVDVDGGGPLRTVKTKAERLLDQLSCQVFSLVSHLPIFFSHLFKSDSGYSPGDWGFAAFTLFCLFLCYSYPFFGFAPLLGVFSGSSRRVRMGVFGCWLAFAVGLFKPVSDPVGTACEFDSPECRNVLHSFELLKPWDPVRSLVVGPVGLGLAILGRLLGGARYIWHFLLRLGIVADCVLAGAYVLSQGRCKKCWGSCVRTAPNEIAFNVFPFTRATRSSLIDLCDRFCAPKGMDPIFLATGWRGCWTGRSPIEQPSEKPIAFAQLDEKRITARTVVAQPYDPNQAVKCLRVLQAGGAMVAEAVPKVVKVSAIPFRAPFFPAGVKVDPECRIVVDPDTFTTALRSGYSTANLVLGTGDFAQLNGLKIRQISKPSGGGPHLIAALHVACSMALHMLAGVYVTAVGSCGAGTNDPWCTNPFAVPGYGPGSLCTSRLCISQHGLTLPLTALVAGFGLQEIALVVLIFVSIGGMAHRLSCKADMLCILLAIASYVWVPLTWLLCVFPCWLRWFSLHPLTILWLVFFLISVNMPSGILAVVLLVSLWLLGRYTNIAGLVTPYDIHHYTSGPRGVAALATAPDGTYLAAVRRAALTGRTMLFTPSQLGSLLEGAFRTQKPSLNTVNVVGSSMGSGGVFTIDGKIKCVTAAHVLTGNSARVSGVGFNQMLDFDVKGDFAIADCPNWQGVAPKARFCEDGWTGRAYWLTSSGVEPGVIGNGFAFCFTACGDSGSPVITEAGELVGVHTGSNKQGGGIVTRPSGQFCNVKPIKLSELSEFFAGPKVPLGDVKIGSHIINDTCEVPSDLCALLAAKPELEGGLSTVQLLCVFFLLWRMMGHAWTPLVAVGFFILNEILPAVLVRSVFSFGMFVLSWLTPWSAQVLMIRLLTASLNRNKLSLGFYSLGAITSFVADLAVTQGHPLQVVMNLSTYAFLPRTMVVTSPVPVIACGVVHLLAIILYLFKYRCLHYVLVGDGVFSSAFFLRYFAEGKLREGVSQSCGMSHESLTGALAMRLTDEDLDFLTKWTDFKCFVSASNMRNAAGQFIEAAYAKALRIELAQLVQVDKVRGTMAKLEAFADTVAPQLSPGDIVVALGHTPVGSIFDLKVGSTKHTLQAIETRVLAGSKMTVARVVDPTPAPPPVPVPIPLPPKVLENGPNAWGDEDRLNKKKRRRMEAVGIFVMDGKKYQKFWDKNSGDVFYEEVHISTDEWECLRTGDPVDFDPETGIQCGHITIEDKVYNVFTSPSGRRFLVPANPENRRAQWEAAKLSVEQALGMMNVDGELTAKELEKLKRIIDKLQGLTKEQCLNC
uniref:Nonstructural protein ORF1a n=1 Tax=Porcine reproductive and respiratory syndrome virus TaxID=28344 RepID=A0A1W5X084_PRRSV|nr:nonstructural protein ORF1a [Porcine reproductive and respiratory syndrome virus]